MILSRIQFRRFFKLLDPLTAYANERLDVVSRGELESGALGFDERAQAKVLNELWQNLGVVDQFIAENPAGMSHGELEVVRTWRESCLTDNFCVWRFPDGRILLMNGSCAFNVFGLSKEIEGMLHAVPAFVQTTLLPFDGVIVYSEYMLERPVAIGDGMMHMLRESADKIAADGSIVETARDFVRESARLREEELAHDLEALSADLEDDASAAQPVPDQHRGVLAGMSFEERDRAIRSNLDAELAKEQNVANRLVALLDERCTPGPVKTSLTDLLADDPELEGPALDKALAELDIEKILDRYEEGDKRDSAREFLAKHLEEMKAGLTHEGLQQYLTAPENLELIIGGCGSSQIAAYRALVECEGRMSVEVKGLETLLDLPYPRRGLCYVFREGDTFEFVMPDEVLATARQLDWDAIGEGARKREGIVRFFEALVELRGIAVYTEAMSDYFATITDGYTDVGTANDALMQAIESEEAGLYLLDDGDEIYALHFELVEAYVARRGEKLPDESLLDETAMLEGPLDSLLTSLLRAHEGHAPRVPTPEMLAEPSLFFWKEKQPAARAMCAYLDEHVPDGEDDYYFADAVMEDLIEEAKWSGFGKPSESVKVFFDILEDHGFIPAEKQVQPLLNLWMNMCNGLPIWANNGWSPAELASSDPDHPVFFNEDGSVKKVGRNDPCPCGSGKKYKKCHGW